MPSEGPVVATPLPGPSVDAASPAAACAFLVSCVRRRWHKACQVSSPQRPQRISPSIRTKAVAFWRYLGGGTMCGPESGHGVEGIPPRIPPHGGWMYTGQQRMDAQWGVHLA